MSASGKTETYNTFAAGIRAFNCSASSSPVMPGRITLADCRHPGRGRDSQVGGDGGRRLWDGGAGRGARRTGTGEGNRRGRWNRRGQQPGSDHVRGDARNVAAFSAAHPARGAEGERKQI